MADTSEDQKNNTTLFWILGIVGVLVATYIGTELKNGHDILNPPRPVVVNHEVHGSPSGFSGDRSISVVVHNKGGAGKVVVTATQEDGMSWDHVEQFDADEEKTVEFVAQGGSAWTQGVSVKVAAQK